MLIPALPPWVRLVSDVLFYAAALVVLSSAVGLFAVALALPQPETQGDHLDSWDTGAPVVLDVLAVTNLRNAEARR